MKKSLKYVNGVFEKYALDNPEIKMYRTAIEIDIADSDNLEYPLMTATYEDQVTFEHGEATIGVTMFFFDRMMADKSNFLEVLSDTMLMASDFYAEFDPNQRKYEFFIAKEPIPLIPSISVWNDEVAGYEMTFKVKIAAFRNQLQIPEY